MTTTALIYTRVSEDRSHGRSVREQEAECRATCEQHGWTVADVITDSRGASRHSKGKRTGWAKVLQRLEAGDVDVLVTWEASRAARDLEAYARLRDLCAEHGVKWSYGGKVHDLTDADDRLITGLEGLLSERYSDEISARVQRATRAQAKAGLPHGRRLFGYQRVYDPDTRRLTGQEPDPDEAPVVRRVFEEYLSGRSLRSITQRLNADGVTTSTGKPWKETPVRRMLENPAYRGLRVHKGEIVGEAAWEPLVDPAAFDRVQARLEARALAHHRPNPPKSRLLTGVARCSQCGGKMTVGKDGAGRRLYQCRGCLKIARHMEALDGYVTEVLLARLALPDVADVMAAVDAPDEATEASAEAAELRQRLEDAAASYAAGELSVKMLARIEVRLEPRIKALEKQARQAATGLDLEVPSDPAEVREWWEDLAPDQRREVVAALVDALVIHPTGRGRKKFNPADIELHWRS